MFVCMCCDSYNRQVLYWSFNYIYLCACFFILYRFIPLTQSTSSTLCKVCPFTPHGSASYVASFWT